MFKDELSRRDVTGGVPTAAMLPVLTTEPAKAASVVPATTIAAGRWAVGTYVSAWRRLCAATWHEELENPLFRGAAEAAEADTPGPPADAHRLRREAWRNYIRSWWFAARHYYLTPADIPDDWIIEQLGRDAGGYPGVVFACGESEREACLSGEEADAVYAEHQDATWSRMEELIATGEFWPLHLDAGHVLPAQFETLPQWAASASSASACASWWRVVPFSP